MIFTADGDASRPDATALETLFYNWRDVCGQGHDGS